MGNYSKMIGAIVGTIAGVLVSNFGLPAEFASAEIQGAVTVVLAAAVTWLFPANKPS